MLKELSWYIESGRFSEIVQEFENKAESYSQSILAKDGTSEEKKEEFRNFCQWHMKKSGFRSEEIPFIDVDAEFFNGADINRAALNTFEKEIVKAHMYQKHLWEFMGTTASMTVISKTAMKNDGFDYNKYLPIEYKKNHPAKSPISNILAENPDAVPFYMYLDGTVSSEYDPEKSIARFDSIKDKSGFDWAKKGWDPNYELTKKDWHGEFDENGNWTMVQNQDSGFSSENSSSKNNFEKFPEIEILKDGEAAVLYDPEFSLLSTIERYFLLEDGEIYGAEVEDIAATVKLIQTAMQKMGVTKIKTIAGSRNEFKKNGKKADAAAQKEILESYRQILGEQLIEKPELISEKEYKLTKEEIAKREENSRIEKDGVQLSVKLNEILKHGTSGQELVRALNTNMVKVPLSVYNKADCAKAGISEEDFSLIQNYYVPDEKKSIFSAAIINLLAEEKLLSTSGKTKEEIFDTVYKTIVQNQKTDEVISVETTLEEICKNPEKNLGAAEVDAATKEKLEAAAKNIPEQRTPEKQKEVDAAIRNVIRNFDAIRMSTGMTPEEAVKAAVKILGGKTGDPFVPPVSGIVYQTPGGNNGSAGSKRIFADLSLQNLIEGAAEKTVQTKEVAVSVPEASSDSADEEKSIESSPEKTGILNIFDEKARQNWYKTEQFRQTGLSEEQAEKLILEEYEKAVQKYSHAKKEFSVSEESLIEEKYGYSVPAKSENSEAARILPATRSISAEKSAEKLNKQSGFASVNGKSFYKPAQIKADGKVSRKMVMAVTSRNENGRNQDEKILEVISELLSGSDAVSAEIRNLSGLDEIQVENGEFSASDAEIVKSKILYGVEENLFSPEAIKLLEKLLTGKTTGTSSGKNLIEKMFAVRQVNVSEAASLSKLNSAIGKLSGEEVYDFSKNLAGFSGSYAANSVLYGKDGMLTEGAQLYGRNGISTDSRSLRGKNGVASDSGMLRGKDGVSTDGGFIKGADGIAVQNGVLAGKDGFSVQNDGISGKDSRSVHGATLTGKEGFSVQGEQLSGKDGIDAGASLLSGKNALYNESVPLVSPDAVYGNGAGFESGEGISAGGSVLRSGNPIYSDSVNFSAGEGQYSASGSLNAGNEISADGNNLRSGAAVSYSGENLLGKNGINTQGAELSAGEGIVSSGKVLRAKDRLASRGTKLKAGEGLSSRGAALTSGNPLSSSGENFKSGDFTPSKGRNHKSGSPESSDNSIHKSGNPVTSKSRSRKSGKPDFSSQQALEGEDPEEIRMQRINANYEHDKAVLAKSDPVFAKNQFWDIGHAEGSGEITEREKNKLSENIAGTLYEKIGKR